MAQALHIDERCTMDRTRRRPTGSVGAGRDAAVEDETILVRRTEVVKGKDIRGRERREVLEVRKFLSEPAYVRMNQGLTKNLGNFESLRVDVSISIPCYPEEVSRVVEELGAQVAAYLETEINAYQMPIDEN